MIWDTLDVDATIGGGASAKGGLYGELRGRRKDLGP